MLPELTANLRILCVIDKRLEYDVLSKVTSEDVRYIKYNVEDDVYVLYFKISNLLERTFPWVERLAKEIVDYLEVKCIMWRTGYYQLV